MRTKTRASALAALSAGLLITATACGGDGGGSSNGGDENTITWWHNSNNEPGKGFYEQVAKDFEAENEGIDVQVQAMAHEDMVS